MANIPGQIMSELGELGKKVGEETARAPVDITKDALETLSGQKKPKKQTQKNQKNNFKNAPDKWDNYDNNKKADRKRKIARAALEALVNKRKKEKSSSVWEQIQNEKENQKTQKIAYKKISKKDETLKLKPKKARGDLYGLAAKTNPQEIGKNVKHD